jgi:hypothetical protein
MIGSIKPQNINFQKWTDNMKTTKNDPLFYNNPYHIAASLIFDNIAIAQIANNYKINTDNIAYTDYFAFENFKEENIWENLKFINENRNGIESFFLEIENNTLMDRFIKGNIYLTTGLFYQLQNDEKEFYRNLEKACMVNPENEEYPLLIDLSKQF